MPVIVVSRRDLERLVGRSLTYEEIFDYLTRLKCEVERIGEDVIEYEATHDRPDLFSVEGLARAIRIMNGEKQSFEFIDENIVFYNKGVPYRPYVAFAIVKNIVLDDEAIKQIMQLQEKLASIYGRKRRKASIGVYDFDKFKIPIYYELADPMETRFIPLDYNEEMNLLEILEKTEKGREFGWIIRDYDKYPILKSADNVVLSLAPILNSDYTKVTVNTKNVLIDSTGTDPKLVVDMVTVMATSIAERSSDRRIYIVKTIGPGDLEITAPRTSSRKIEVPISSISNVIGIDIKLSDVIDYLNRSGYTHVDIVNDKLLVEPPIYRIDVINWIDIVEDIAIMHGFYEIGVEAEDLPHTSKPGRIHPLEFVTRKVRRFLANYGFIEAPSYMLSNRYQQIEMFELDSELICVDNPKLEKYSCLRIWLTPGLLEVLVFNKVTSARIFEIGDVVGFKNPKSKSVEVERRVGILITHDKATLTDGLVVLNTLFEEFGIKPTYRESQMKGFLSNRFVEVLLNNIYVGFAGEIHPSIIKKFGLENPVVVAEIILDRLLEKISI